MQKYPLIITVSHTTNLSGLFFLFKIELRYRHGEIQLKLACITSAVALHSSP